MQYLFDAWQAAGSPSPLEFSADELALWIQPIEFIKLAAALPIDSALYNRIRQIIELPN
jgi:hypothetical protein